MQITEHPCLEIEFEEQIDLANRKIVLHGS